jgi:hypothetical protein
MQLWSELWFPYGRRTIVSSKLTLAVVAEGHLGLAEANGVFALGDAIELLEFRLVDALHQKSGGVVKKAGSCSRRCHRACGSKHLPGWGSKAQWP